MTTPFAELRLGLAPDPPQPSRGCARADQLLQTEEAFVVVCPACRKHPGLWILPARNSRPEAATEGGIPLLIVGLRFQKLGDGLHKCPHAAAAFPQLW